MHIGISYVIWVSRMQVRDNIRLHPYILVLTVHQSCLKVQVCLDPGPISFDCNFIIKYFKRIECVKPHIYYIRYKEFNLL